MGEGKGGVLVQISEITDRQLGSDRLLRATVYFFRRLAYSVFYRNSHGSFSSRFPAVLLFKYIC